MVRREENSRLRGGTGQTPRNCSDLKVLSVIGHSRGRKNHELTKRRDRLTGTPGYGKAICTKPNRDVSTSPLERHLHQQDHNLTRGTD
jgi:hypothetical protein